MSTAMLMSLSDVSLLAKVRRPVVSMWRKRPGPPFPASVAISTGQELFDAQDVIGWLEATGRGNNPTARADAAAFSALAGAPREDDMTFHGLTAMLCLHAAEGSLPGGREALLDLADEADPDDEHLYAEVEGLGDRLEALARYASLLVSAAYHPGAAFEQLVAGRSRSPLTGSAQTALSSPARQLVVATAIALGVQAEFPDPVYVDPTPGGSDLLVELVARVGDRSAVTVATPSPSGPAGRLALRRLRVHDVVRQPLRDDGEGGPVLPDQAVVLAQYPAPDQPAMSDLDVLRAVNEVVLASTDRQRAVVIGPASALTDRLTADRGEAASVRDDILRTDRVRAVVRLPAGLLRSRPRQRLALWCLGPSPEPRGPRPPDAERRLLTADLTNAALDGPVLEGLVTDLVAGMDRGRGRSAHVLQFARPAFTRNVLAQRGDLVTAAPATGRVPAAADVLADVDVLSAALREPLPAVPVPAVTAVGARRHEGPTTVEAALRRRDLVVLAGLRIREEHLCEGGAVRVLGPPELTSGAGVTRRSVDRLDLAAHYPTGEYTEPGDVVFATSPRPAALVDAEGGSIVAFPARVLRCRAPGLVPWVLAADVNAQPADAKAWRAWSIRQVPPDQVSVLSGVLGDTTRHRALLTERLSLVDRLATALIAGVTGGLLDLTTD